MKDGAEPLSTADPSLSSYQGWDVEGGGGSLSLNISHAEPRGYHVQAGGALYFLDEKRTLDRY